ncbi:carboxylesterase [Hortaea werneckii]|nr:carboxylesterase [Hortaea werneckii]
MIQDQYEKRHCRFEAGPLGHLEGLTLSLKSEPDEPVSRYFGGLPYGLPPIGPYRFRRPRALPDNFRYGTKSNPGNFTGSAAFCPQPGFRRSPDEPMWDEDCLQLNIHIPAEEAPSKDGWPVFFYIHGGFLQWGDPNMPPTAVAPLITETAFKAIVVMPAYRLNAFGFLASRELQAVAARNGETSGNMGFWDQRQALEWTARNIGHFGGDSTNITVAGYSAGSHSTFQQLAHELYLVPDKEAIIKRAIMWSNSPGVQPKTLDEHQKQFDELLTALNIPMQLSGDEKVQRLRSVSAHDLIKVQDGMNLSEFRALTDGAFIPKNIIANINSGGFGRRMKKRGIKLMNGECRDEHYLYESWRTPSPSYEAVYTRLCADYPEQAVRQLMGHVCGKERKLPEGVDGWQDLFGRLYANMQVHCLERGFCDALVKGGLIPGQDLLRYRFNWRADCVTLPREWKVTHATDMAIWFWGEGQGEGLKSQEKQVLEPWNRAFADFVSGRTVEWGTNDAKDMRRLKEDGNTDIWTDDRWEEGLEIWNLVNGNGPAGFLSWFRSKL